ncbi:MULTISPECIES: hypothetical protein [Micromonospora]|uniref:hypothetical protein n=1 Tax=Micromonospora TaxID=1873 RepID=UPI002417B0BD|nr:hypothetical protein [Micromonospora sp. WMMD718]MDG4749329.1 hypothetical protein [Micromonospora sp. WMMD718]MDG4756071.1 hypothetical protein [Micromonospora sp. WMMD718]
MAEIDSHLRLSAASTGEDAVVVGGMNLSMLVHRLLLTAQAGEPPQLVLELSPRAYVVDAAGSVVGVSPAGHAALVGLGWQPPGTAALLVDVERQRDQLAEVVDDMLREYTVHGRPGREAVRTPWLDPAKVQRWRRRRRELRPPDDPV